MMPRDSLHPRPTPEATRQTVATPHRDCDSDHYEPPGVCPANADPSNLRRQTTFEGVMQDRVTRAAAHRYRIGDL